MKCLSQANNYLWAQYMVDQSVVYPREKYVLDNLVWKSNSWSATLTASLTFALSLKSKFSFWLPRGEKPSITLTKSTFAHEFNFYYLLYEKLKFYFIIPYFIGVFAFVTQVLIQVYSTLTLLSTLLWWIWNWNFQIIYSQI